MKRIRLTKEEQDTEGSADELVPASKATREGVERIVERSKRNEAISLRMSSFDLRQIRARAAEQGMPYQTLINVPAHEYVTNQVLDNEEYIEALQVARESGAI